MSAPSGLAAPRRRPTLVLIPLTFSITQGILWGFILHVLLYTVAGRRREVPATLWVLALISVGLLLLES